MGTKDINIYPNPAKDFINIEIGTNSNELLEVEVINSSGISVLSKNIEKGLSRVNLENLPNGSYIVQIIENGSIIKNLSLIKIE